MRRRLVRAARGMRPGRPGMLTLWALLALLLWPTAGAADEWSRTYQTDPDLSLSRAAWRVAHSSDCGWLFAGYARRRIETTGEVISDAWVIQTDAEGAILWSRGFGGGERDNAVAAAPAGDGGHVVLVDSRSFGPFPGMASVPWLVKLDRLGGVEWQISYDDEWALDIAGPLPGGGVLVLGSIDRDVWLIELAPTGEEIRQRRLAGSSDVREIEGGIDLARTADGGFLVAAARDHYGVRDVWLVKLDAALEIEWQKLYGDEELDESLPSVWQTSDGGYLLAVRLNLGRDPDGNPQNDAVIWRLDAEGAPIWSRRFDAVADSGLITGVVETADGGIVLAHDTDRPSGLDDEDTRLLRLDAAGNPQWMREYTPGYDDVSGSLLPLSDGGLLLAATTRRIVDGNQGGPNETWLLRLGADGLIGGDGCGFTRDVLVDELPYAPRVADTDAYFEETAVGRIETDAFLWEPDVFMSEDCSAPSCLAPRCGPAIADPYEVCEGETVDLTLSSACGEGAVSIDWDLDGDGVPDAQGPSVQATLPPGTHEVAATVTDSCLDPGPGTCESKTTVTVLSSEPPGEVSGPAETRLRVARKDDGIVGVAVESAPRAAAYNVYADRIGSWYAPGAATGSACHRTSWTDLGGGAVEIDHALPLDSWIVVTASTPCAEGPAGPDSTGAERTDRGAWELCGPASP